LKVPSIVKDRMVDDLTVLVLTSTYRMFSSVAVYPRKIPVKSCLSSLHRRFAVRLTQTLEPNTLNLQRSGLIPCQASKGVIIVARWTRRLWSQTACNRAADQKVGGSPELYSRTLTVTTRTSFHFSTDLFCDELSAPVGSTGYCQCVIWLTKSWLRANSPPWSHRMDPPSLLPKM
jgi:hypothetical protein